MIEYFQKKFPAYYFLVAVLLTSLFFFSYLTWKEKSGTTTTTNQVGSKYANSGEGVNSTNNPAERTNASSSSTNSNGEVITQDGKTHDSKKTNEKHVVRSNANKFTRPILMVESTSKAEELSSLDNSLQNIIETGKHNGKVQSASVYIMDMDNDTWTEINDGEGYYPGSLMKLAVFICYLKKSEEHPEILYETLKLEKTAMVPGQSYKDNIILPDVPYKVSDLFYPMIVRSDNFATLLLNRELDLNILNDLFITLGIKKMDMQNIKYEITASDYSKFMRVLYNATYLNAKNSQYALSLLSNSTFNKGMTRNLPKNVVVAHKFGENVSGQVRQLHESGIVYSGARTYLITIMTKGEKVADLADIICDISSKTYDFFKP